MITGYKIDSIFIPGNVPSSKNSRAFNIKRRRSFMSAVCARYIKNTERAFSENTQKFLTLTDNKIYPLHVKFKYVRESRREFDFINMAQILQDLMVANGWIPDDNYKCIVPVFDEEVLFDKDNPGVYITVL